jgi:hypothetical protein
MDQQTIQKDLGAYVVPGVIAIVGIVLFVESYSISVAEAAKKSNIITSDFFPRLIAIGIIILSLTSMIQTFIKQRNTVRDRTTNVASNLDSQQQTVFPEIRGLLICLALIIGFFLLFKPAGFIVSALVFITAYLRIFGRRKFLFALLYAFAYVTVIYLSFRYAFRVLPPNGFLF